MATMTDAQRREAVTKLLNESDDLKKKLEALGYSSTPKPDKREKSPDGGPASDAHVYLKTQILPTVEVYMKGPDGNVIEGMDPVVINNEDFDDDLHERVVAKGSGKRKRTRRLDRTLPGGVKLGRQSREDLLTMTTSLLRALPETKLLSEIPSSKTDLVEAILEVRKQYKAA